MKINFLILSFLLLVLIKILAIFTTSFNLFGDEAQYWLWSKDLDFGYYSKPPFLSWFIFLYTSLFGDSFISLKLIPSFVYFLVACALYSLSKNIGLKKEGALSCAIIFLFIPAVSFSSFILSTDIFLLLFWVLSLNELMKIKKAPNISRFVLLGIILGLAFLSKYAAIYFFICLLIYIFIDQDFRLTIYKNYIGFLIFILCFMVTIIPNILWNFNNEWVTVQHTSDNANFQNLKPDFFRGIFFLITQILMIGPFLFFGNITNYRLIRSNQNNKFLLTFSLPIFFIVFVEAVLVRAHANWAAPALISFFLFLFINIRNINSIFYKINVFFNFIFCLIFFTLIALSYQLSLFDRISGLKKYAEDIYIEGKRAKISNYVVTDRLLFSSLSYELKDKNLTFLMPHVKAEKITNHFQISSPLKKEMVSNFLLIGSPVDIGYLTESFEIEKTILPKGKYNKANNEIYKITFNN